MQRITGAQLANVLVSSRIHSVSSVNQCAIGIAQSTAAKIPVAFNHAASSRCLESTAPQKLVAGTLKDFGSDRQKKGLLLANKGPHNGVRNDVAQVVRVIYRAAMKYPAVHQHDSARRSLEIDRAGHFTERA